MPISLFVLFFGSLGVDFSSEIATPPVLSAIAPQRTIAQSDDLFIRTELTIDLAEQLARVGEYDGAVEVARSIEADYQQQYALGRAAVQAIANGDIDAVAEILPNITSSNELMNLSMFLSEAGEFDLALQAADRGGGEAALSRIAADLARSGQIDRALEIADLVTDNPGFGIAWHSEALAEIAVSLARSGDNSKARTLALEIPDAETRAIALTRIAIAFDEAGETVLARVILAHSQLRLRQHILDDRLRDNALLGMGEATLEAGKIDWAQRISEEVSEQIYRTWIWVKIAIFLGENGSSDASDSYFVRARENLNRFDNSHLSLNVVRAGIIIELSQAGYIHLAREFSRTIEHKMVRVFQLQYLARMAGDRDDLELAEDLLDEALNFNETIEDSRSQSASLFTIVEAFTYLKQFDRALEIARSVPKIGDERASTLRMVAGEIAESGDVDRAIEVANDIENETWRRITFSEVASKIAFAGRISEALALAEEIENSQLKSHALTNISIAIARQQDFDGAVELANTIEVDLSRSRAFLGIAREAIETGDRQRGSQLLSQARSLLVPQLRED